MIYQTRESSVSSRDDCNPYLSNGNLPLITAPMNTVIDENNYHIFAANKINICLPRTINTIFWEDNIFISMSLNDFIKEFLERTESFIGKRYVCIDTANGNMKSLHEAIIKAKEQHGDNLIIMAGNVASRNAFYKLASIGCDYIRVGIGGGLGCNTSNNVGIGQEDLGELIYDCYKDKKESIRCFDHWKDRIDDSESDYYKKNPNTLIRHKQYYKTTGNVAKAYIVADGISTYIKQCQEKYGFNDNGYAAINKLLWLGADLVMIGSLFSQAYESAAEKYIKVNEHYFKISQEELEKQTNLNNVYSKYYGMSSFAAQVQYRPSTSSYNEGSIKYLPIKYYLPEWIYGNSMADYYPYLSGWVNSVKSAMSYTDSFNLNQFKIKQSEC